jgi:hypothetical protein
MPKFICNTNNFINWNNFIETIDYHGSVMPNFLFDVSKTIEENLVIEVPEGKGLPTDDYTSIENTTRSPFNWHSVNWTDYNLEHSAIVDKISLYLEVNVLRSFVSKVDPGICVPLHWDIGDVQFRTKDNLDKIFRYTCFIRPPVAGQTFSVDQHCFYNEKEGNLYEWNHYTDVHSTFNASTEPHYIFHLVGEKK